MLHSVPEGCSWGTAVPLTSVPVILPGRVPGGSGSGLFSPPCPGLQARCAASIFCVNAAAGHVHVHVHVLALARRSLTEWLSGSELCPGSPHRWTDPGQLTGRALCPWLCALCRRRRGVRARGRPPTVLGGSLACSPPGSDQCPQGGRVCSGPRVLLLSCFVIFSSTPAPAWDHTGASLGLLMSSRGDRHPWVLKSGSVPLWDGLWPMP